MAAMLASAQAVKICGLFLAGINDDQISLAYKRYHPPSSFLNIPIWLSSGTGDAIAPPWKHEHVRASLVYTGFKRVRVESFDGGHEVDAAQVKLALRWFRQLGSF
jgi:predicted esterase